MPEEVPEKTFKKRSPAVFTNVDKLNKEMNRISLVGTIVSRNTQIFSFLLDDGTGTVNIIMNDSDQFSKLKDGQFVRVFGRIWGEGSDIEIQSDLVQDFDKMDKELFKKVFG